MTDALGRLLCLVVLVALPLVARAADHPKPPMLAAYYVWYATGTGPHGKWAGWSKPGEPSSINPSGHDADRFVFPPYLRDIRSAAYPLVGPYDSDDIDVARWHIRLAKAAGITAFAVSWWGPGTWQDVRGLTQSAFEKAVLPAAEQEDFKLALMDETAQFHNDFEEVKRWAVQYLAKYKDSPAYLRIDGKPVYYLYQVPFAPRLTPRTFAELKAHVEAKIGPVYWIVDKISNAGDRLHIPEEWLAGDGGGPARHADAYAFYCTFSNFRAWTYTELIDRYTGVVRAAHAAGLKMMVPVHPGHDNSRLRDKDFFVIPRRDGQTLRDYLRAASDSGADYILLTSWNEWPETTVVEPAVTWDDPYRYLKIIAEFNGTEFRAPPEPRRVPLGSTTQPVPAS